MEGWSDGVSGKASLEPNTPLLQYSSLPHLPHGVRFECTRCGACCTGAPGIVRISEPEQQAMAKSLEITHESFSGRYLREVDGETSLRESANGDCVFLRDNQCQVHAVRPQQCRTYPFWFKNLRSEANWKRTCAECPGIGEGRLYGREEILARVAGELDADPE